MILVVFLSLSPVDKVMSPRTDLCAQHQSTDRPTDQPPPTTTTHNQRRFVTISSRPSLRIHPPLSLPPRTSQTPPNRPLQVLFLLLVGHSEKGSEILEERRPIVHYPSEGTTNIHAEKCREQPVELDATHNRATMVVGESNERTPLSIHPSSITAGDGGNSVWSDLERRRGAKSGVVAQESSRNKWLVLLFGQLIALVAASQNAASFTLEYGMGKVFPCFLMLHTYIVLSIHLWFMDPPKVEESFRVPMTSIRIRTPWWYCLFLSILDVTPNYLTLLSLKHTTLTSSTLLGSLTAPSIMLSCHLLLRKTYRPAHCLGALLCISGGLLTVWTDLATSSNESNQSNLHPHSYFGDILAVTAAILYGIGDAVGEFWCKHVDRKEYLGMIGFFGAIFCCILVLFTERDEVVNLFQDRANLYPALGVLALYVPTLVLYYVLASVFLVSSDATLLNLSLQSSNLWAICFSVLAFQEAPSSLFYTALVLVVSGVFVYELLGNSSSDEKKEIAGHASEPFNRQQGIEPPDFC